MPSPRRHLRGRRQAWNDRHHSHLLTGHDWGKMLASEGWGHLSTLADETLRETIADMQACWDHEHHKVIDPERGLHHPGPPWFAEFAGPEGNARLFAECRERREFVQYQRANGGYTPGCYEDFLKSYTPPEPASAAAEPIV
jgi:hypothetical protein